MVDFYPDIVTGLLVEYLLLDKVTERIESAAMSRGKTLVVRLQYADSFQVSSTQLDSVLTDIRKVYTMYWSIDQVITATPLNLSWLLKFDKLGEKKTSHAHPNPEF